MRTLKILFVACLLLIFSAGIALAVYPEQSKETPYVTDLAGVMSKDDIQKLNSELKDYNIRTSNEVVVVTVTSLDGMNAVDYARELFNYWGVGKAQKNNGVLLLLSPNDRDVAIQVGLGLEDIMPDNVRGEILDNDVVPYLKKDQLSEGLQAGANSIMRHLDQATRPTQGQVQNVQSPPGAVQNQAQPPTTDGGKVISFIILIIVIIGIVVLVGRSREKAKSKKEIVDRLKGCEDKQQQELLDRFNNATVKLTILKKENPRSVWEKLDAAFGAINFDNIAQQISAIRMKYTEKGLNYDEVNGMLDVLEKELYRDIAVCKEIEEMQSKVKNAKEKSAKLLEQLPKEMEKTQGVVAHQDVFPETKAKFDSIKASLQVAQTKFEGNSNEIDWIASYKELSDLEKSFDDIHHHAQNDIAKVERARKEGPQLLQNLPRMMDETEEELMNSGGSVESIARARNEYTKTRNMPGTSDIQVYLQLMAINSALEQTKRDNTARIERERQEVLRKQREAEERARRYLGGGGGFSGTGGGTHRSYGGGGGGGGHTGGGGGTSRKY